MNRLQKKRVHNARHPKGFWGAVTLASMNDDHAGLTDDGLGLIDVKPTATCLDIGCGGGRTLSRLAELACEGKVCGVDISDTAIKCARKYNLRNIRSGRIELKKGRAYAIPYPKNTFDTVTAVETFYFWENKPLALKNIREVMKEGGTLIIMLDAYDDGSNDFDELKEEIGLELTKPEDMKAMLEAEFGKTEIVLSGKRMYAIAVK